MKRISNPARQGEIAARKENKQTWAVQFVLLGKLLGDERRFADKKSAITYIEKMENRFGNTAEYILVKRHL